VLRAAPELLALAGSSSSMWAANAATVAPSARHRRWPSALHAKHKSGVDDSISSLEAEATTATLRAIFADSTRFVVHDPFARRRAPSLMKAPPITPGSPLRAAWCNLFGWGREALPGG